MIDLHTHSLFSDGELLPSELISRFNALGYEYIAITDHADDSNLDWVIPRILHVTERVNRFSQVQALAGIELTHVPPQLIPELTREAYGMGACLVLAHGETIVEPVPAGTNLAAIEAGVDILAHPGLLTEEEALLAVRMGVHLEITARKGHSLGNGRVARLAERTGAKMVLNTDAHSPGDLISETFARSVVLGAGLTENHFTVMLENSRNLVRKALTRISS